jgi:hypothetical protein
MTEYSDANHEDTHEKALLKEEGKDDSNKELKLASDAKIA